MKKEKSCGCIVIEDNKVLVIQQVKGHWAFPKGHVEEGETEIETAKREVKEETNLIVEIDVSKRYAMNYITDNQIDKEVVIFVAKKVGGEIQIQEKEIADIAWLDFKEAFERLTYENAKVVLQQVINDLYIK